MKVTLIEQKGIEKELIIKYDSIDNEIQELLSFVNSRSRKLVAINEGTTYLLEPLDVLYCESVDSHVFLYTSNSVHKTPSTLCEIEETFQTIGFFRCSKSMIINIHHIHALKSSTNARIITTLTNGERIVVSRHYSKKLRSILR